MGLKLNLIKQKEILAGMTDGPWSSHNKNALSAWLVYPPKERFLIEDRSLGPDEPRLYPLKETEGNAKGIAMMRNHYEALLDLAEAVQIACNEMAIVYGRNTIQTKLQAALEKIEKIDS